MKKSISNFISWPYQQFKRLLRLLKLILRTIHLGGGLANTTRKILNTFKLEGIAGVKARVQYLRTNGAFRSIHGSGWSDRNAYPEWTRRYNTLSDSHRLMMKNQIDQMAMKPLISIVMPTYNSNIDWLSQAIESVQKQAYPHWELCIADDASTNPKVRNFLKDTADQDQRIKLVFREKNGHISAASNSALELAQGEWIALLDHDDLLTEDALFFVAKAITENASAALIYSDEDKIDINNVRSGPYFKPDWNYELFLSHNLITHLGVYKKEIVEKIGGFREGFEGAQDYDLALRFIDCIEPPQIIHIPKVLYHWRMHDESTAKSSKAKPYAMLAGERAINDRFKRLNIDAKAEYVNFGYKVTYSLPPSVVKEDYA